MKRILVTGAGGSAAYNYIESLRNNPAGEEFYIVGADMSHYHIELANVDKRYIIPGVKDPQYLEKINQIIETEKIDFLHCQPDVEVDYFSNNKDKVKAKMLLPKAETIALCQNKMEFNRVLKEAGLSVPKAFYLTSEEDLESGMAELLKDNEKIWLRAIKGAGQKLLCQLKK